MENSTPVAFNQNMGINGNGLLSQSPIIPSVVSVRDLLQYPNLKIPGYQRPYKWTHKNVNQLLGDIIHNRNKPAYRLGTIVLHKDHHGFLNIVDGQQRTISLLLIVKAIFNNKAEEIEDDSLKETICHLHKTMFQPTFSNDISKDNIYNNYREIERTVNSLNEETISFLLNKCGFNQFVLTNISEAFQFFDSQNARGKDLEPHDLLKAFHLREFSLADNNVKENIVETWESMKTEKLANLFSNYLFRIKGWSKGESSRFFTKNETILFKGVNIDKIENYPYTKLFRIAHHYVDGYNSSYERLIEQDTINFPFQLDQIIINGRRFFEMIKHYKMVFDTILEKFPKETELSNTAQLILTTIKDYEGRNRIGDNYVKDLFDCALIFYIDKFELREISKAIEKIFIWSYMLRLQYHSVQFSSVDNYVLNDPNFFKIIRNSTQPSDVLNVYLKPLREIRSTKTAGIEAIFQQLNYYDNRTQ